MIEMEMGIVAAGIVPNPPVVRVNVGRIRVSGLIVVFAVFRPLSVLISGRPGTMRRNVPATNRMIATAVLLAARAALRAGRYGTHQQHDKESNCPFHLTPPLLELQSRADADLPGRQELLSGEDA
jgi:hypothetical protein